MMELWRSWIKVISIQFAHVNQLVFISFTAEYYVTVRLMPGDYYIVNFLVNVIATSEHAEVKSKWRREIRATN